MKSRPFFEVPHIDSIQHMLISSAGRFGDKLALDDLRETPMPRITYSGLLRDVLKFGTALRAAGLRERTHVAVIGENRAQWGIAYLTAHCFNFVVVPVDKNLSPNEILNILHESDSEAVVFSDSYAPLFSERRQSMKRLRWYINMDRPVPEYDFYSMPDMIHGSRGCAIDELPKIRPEELAVIIFTSGTLGRAKGVMLSQQNLASNLMGMVRMFLITPEDRFLSVLPIHHTYECTCGLLCPLYSGASVHYARSLKTVVDDLQQVRATILLGVPLLYDKMFKRIQKSMREKRISPVLLGLLLRACDIAERVGLKNFRRRVFSELHTRFGGEIRCFIAGGAAPDPLVARGLRGLGFSFIQGYGLTETSPILTLNRLDDFKDDAAGLPLPDVEVRIHEPDGEGIGEVRARGRNVMLGFYKNEPATAEAFEAGWFKTGDLGYIDADGFLHISGRKKNVIISRSGKNVFPEEIEDVLNRSSFVLESLVYAEPDPKQDERIAAQIVVDAEAFIEYAESRNVKITDALIQQVVAEEVRKANLALPLYKQIKSFIIREQEFEKTTTQKIKRYLVSQTSPHD